MTCCHVYRGYKYLCRFPPCSHGSHGVTGPLIQINTAVIKGKETLFSSLFMPIQLQNTRLYITDMLHYSDIEGIFIFISKEIKEKKSLLDIWRIYGYINERSAKLYNDRDFI